MTRPASQAWAACFMCVPSPRTSSRALPWMRLTPPSCPPLSHLRARTSHPASCAVLATRQRAYEFNQPLSFDTSSVTEMSSMFHFRVLSSPVFDRRSLTSTTPRRSMETTTASAFNQPLNFDTSRVTRMSLMFGVRALAPTTSSRAILCMRSTPPPRPPTAHTLPRFARPPLRLGSPRTRSTSR